MRKMRWGGVILNLPECLIEQTVYLGKHRLLTLTSHGEQTVIKSIPHLLSLTSRGEQAAIICYTSPPLANLTWRAGYMYYPIYAC